MTARHVQWSLTLVVLLAACGGGGTNLEGTDTTLTDPPAGTSETHVLVAPKPGQDVATIAAAMGAAVLGAVPGTDYFVVSVPSGSEMPGFAQRIRRDGRVEHVEPDYGMSAPEGDGSTLPAGGLLVGASIASQLELTRIGAVVARTRATGADVRIAVLDTGVLPHEELDGHVDPDGWDFVDDDPDPQDEVNGKDDDGNGLIDEGYGHGLFVASLVVAVAPDARIVPFRVLDSDAVGRASVIAGAISRAADLGVDIVNLSLSMDREVGVLEEAIERARARGVLVVASAGNTGEDDVAFPSAIPGAFAVTAVDGLDVRAPFASYGAEVDLAAPGVDLLGAYPSVTGTATWSGTSFSAALVSGACALVRELDPLATPEILFAYLGISSDSLHATNPILADRLGAGRLDLDGATAP